MLLMRYFGTADLDAVDPGALADGAERLRVDFGMETDRSRRFALWTLMHILGVAPDLDVAFADPADREAARNFMDMAAVMGNSTMAEITNLRLARKARKRTDAQQTAAQNRVRFGLTKAQRMTQEQDAARLARTIDGAKRDDPAAE